MKRTSKRSKTSSQTSRKVAREKTSIKHKNSADTNSPDEHTHEPNAAKSDGDFFPIVGVGASAGGLEAYTRLVEHLPTDTGMAFVLVQHLDPEHESKLPQLLGRVTKLPVLEVVNNTRVKPDHIYVIPPNKSMTIERGTLKLVPRKKRDGNYRSLDRFLESLALDQGHQSIGVILSGTATDGPHGLQAIKGADGITFAQDESAKYERFRQAEPTTTRVYGGLGLDLSIVRNIIEMHGGSVLAESKGKGQGATFTVTLPIRALSDFPRDDERRVNREAHLDHVSTSPTPKRLDGVYVLIVDDDADTRELLRVALTTFGAEVTTCQSSSEALAEIMRRKPDCVVSDVGMPSEDGYGFMRKLRALKPKDGGKTPAIALTGFAGADHKALANGAGYQMHLSKPVELAELTSQIARLVEEENDSRSRSHIQVSS